MTCRGNERKAIFRDDKDKQEFIRILSNSLHVYTVKLYSYVFMENHFHLLVETPLGNLGEFMRHFNVSYTGFYNRKYKRSGHLYQGRYKSILVDKDEYLSVLSRYIHLNPVRIKSMRTKTVEDKFRYLQDYPWSSFNGYLGKRRNNLVHYGAVLSEYGGDTARGRRSYKERLLQDIAEGLEVKKNIVGQSVLGGDAFIKWIKESFIKGKDRESPGHREVARYKAEEEIIRAIEMETGDQFEAITKSRHPLRRVAMDILYRIGGMKGVEIGKIFGVDYSTVSQERKRLRKRLEKDKSLRELAERIEGRLSR